MWEGQDAPLVGRSISTVAVELSLEFPQETKSRLTSGASRPVLAPTQPDAAETHVCHVIGHSSQSPNLRTAWCPSAGVWRKETGFACTAGYSSATSQDGVLSGGTGDICEAKEPDTERQVSRVFLTRGEKEKTWR